MQNYITITEKLLSTFEDPATLRFFLWCITSASKTETTVTVRGRTIALLPGQFIYSRRQATEELKSAGFTERKIRTALDLCLASQQTSQQTSQKLTVLSVTNFSTYMDSVGGNVPANVPANVPTIEDQGKNSSGQGENRESITSPTKRNTKNKKSKDKHKDIHKDIQAVLDHYRYTFPSFGRTIKQGHSDWKLIGNRISDGYSVAECVDAINGNSVDGWYCEKNLHAARYIFRDAANMDKFIAGWSNHNRPVISKKAKLGVTAANAWLNREGPNDD